MNNMKLKIALFTLLSIALFAQGKDTVTASFVIEKYLNAIGGRQKLEDIKDRTTEMTGLVHELSVKIDIYQKKPNLFKQVLKLQDLEQTVIFNGSDAIIKTNEEQKSITGQELEKLKLDSDMNFMLSKDTAVAKFNYAGMDTVGAKKVYKIKVDTKSGTWYQYYDTDSGYKLKDEKPMDTPQGKFVQRTWYSDFRNVDGLSFPFKIIQEMGKQTIEFEVLSIKLDQGISDSVFAIEK